MKSEGDPLRPVLGDAAAKLGVRDGLDGRKPDLAPDAGNAVPGNGGLSVVSSIAGLAFRVANGMFPPSLVPQRLNDSGQVPGAIGVNSLCVFRIGEGVFEDALLCEELRLVPDHNHHGTVQPAGVMAYADYRQAISDTQDDWEPGEADL
ncbi:MAG: hypothetical protein C0483_10350 [Pirellula sp.]|nr:hypothetical protein [Pirellula sp.]